MPTSHVTRPRRSRSGTAPAIACAGRGGETLADRREVAAGIEHRARLVGHDQVRAEVAGKRLGGEVVGPDRDPRLRRQCRRQRVDEAPLWRADAFERRRDRVGRGDERTAQLLGQGAGEGGGQLAAETRDVPVETVVGHLVEGEQRDGHRDAVERLARLEAVAQRQRQVVGHRPRVGEVGERDGDAVGGAQHGGGQVELRRIGVASVAPPPIELTRRHDVVRHATRRRSRAPGRRRAGRRVGRGPPARPRRVGTARCGGGRRAGRPTRRRRGRGARTSRGRAPGRPGRSPTVRPVTIARPYSVTVSVTTARPPPSSQRGSPYDRFTRWAPRRSAHSGCTAATRRARRRSVSTSSPAITHRGGCLVSTEPGAMTNEPPRAPRNVTGPRRGSRRRSSRSPRCDSRPASTA